MDMEKYGRKISEICINPFMSGNFHDKCCLDLNKYENNSFENNHRFNHRFNHRLGKYFKESP